MKKVQKAMEKSPIRKEIKIQRMSQQQKIVQKVQKQKVSLQILRVKQASQQILRVEQASQQSIRAMKALLLIQNRLRNLAVKKKRLLL